MERPDSTISPVNRRITWLILVFVFLSLAGSVLPLLTRGGIPLPLFERDAALALHTLVLMAYMAFIFPLSIMAPDRELDDRERRGWDLAWWWVGGFILAFSGVPLFVLAYIAGVSLQSVIAILAWAGLFHGVAVLWTRYLGYENRGLLILVNFLLAVPMPAVSYFAERFGVELDWWSPFAEVRALTLDFAPANLLSPLAALGGVTLLVWLPLRRMTAKPAAVALIVLLPLLGAAMPVGASSAPAAARLLCGDHFVPGRVVPIALETEVGSQVTVEVAGRETLRFAPRPSQSTRRVAHLTLMAGGERIVVRDGTEKIVLERELRPLPRDRRLLLVVGRSELELPAIAEVVRIESESTDRSALGFDPFSAVLLGEGVWQRLDRDQRRALGDWVARGGLLVLPEEVGFFADEFGLGRRIVHEDSWPADAAELPDRATAAAEANLYSSFALPDWGRVDLSGLALFLGLYHVVFYLIFLLPLLLDARKGMSVYLVSVAFVLTLVVVGAYFVLKQRYLPENQILQQNVAVYELTDDAAGTPLLVHQSSCFAAFNASREEIAFALEEEPHLVHPPGARGAGAMRLEEERLVFEDLALDRRARRQIVKLSARSSSPLSVSMAGGTIRIGPADSVVDSFGLTRALPIAAFLRREGRLHRVTIDSWSFRPAKRPDPLGWHGVIPEEMRAEAIPFLAHALGRHAPAQKDVLGVLLSGTSGLHSGSGYLQRRDVVELLLVPVTD